MTLDPSVIVDVRTSVEYRSVYEFARITSQLKYNRFTQIIPISSGKHILYHRLNGAIIKDFGEFGGRADYERPQLAEQSIIPTYQKGGLELPEANFTDDGIMGKIGVKTSGDWAADVAAAGAYWPQLITLALYRSGYGSRFVTGPRNGESFGNCYDGIPLFSVGHPYNWLRPSLGYFSNFFTGGVLSDGRGGTMTTAYGTYPGFMPLAGPFGDGGVEISLAAAWDNLWSVIAYIRTIKMPDGVTPRYLEPTGIICGPKLIKNVLMLLNAQFINMQSGSSGGATEIKGVITKLGLNPPIDLAELGGNTDLDHEEDYDWGLVCEEQAKASGYGSIIYAPREVFDLKMFAAATGSTGINLELAERNLVKWLSQARSGVAPGLPQFMFKIQATR